MDVDLEQIDDPTPKMEVNQVEIEMQTPLKKDKEASEEKKLEQTEAKMECTEENISANDKIPLNAKKMKAIKQK